MTTPCIEFEGRRLTKGYGYINRKLAHRDAWEKANGPIPKGMTAPQIAERYFVTADTLRALKSGFSWKHIYKEFYCATD